MFFCEAIYVSFCHSWIPHFIWHTWAQHSKPIYVSLLSSAKRFSLYQINYKQQLYRPDMALICPVNMPANS